MKILFVCLMMILTAANSTFSQENIRQEFSIYVLPEAIKPNQLAKIDLEKLKPVGSPFIHQNDISLYNQDTHRFKVSNYQVGEKFQNTNVRGRTFAVFVGDEAIYVGAFWSSLLSQSFDGINIDIFGIDKEFPLLQFKLGYPTEKFFKGKDLRSDSRILRAFEPVGKLYDDFEIIGKCKSVKGTQKRHASHIFTFEIVSITKGKFDGKEVEFELFWDFGSKKMLDDLKTDTMKIYDGKGWNFDKSKEFILRFDKRVGRPDPKYHWLKENEYRLKDWSIKN